MGCRSVSGFRYRCLQVTSAAGRRRRLLRQSQALDLATFWGFRYELQDSFCHGWTAPRVVSWFNVWSLSGSLLYPGRLKPLPRRLLWQQSFGRRDRRGTAPSVLHRATLLA